MDHAKPRITCFTGGKGLILFVKKVPHNKIQKCCSCELHYMEVSLYTALTIPLTKSVGGKVPGTLLQAS